MKKLTTFALKVFKLSLVIVALASAPVFAGGNDDKIKAKKSDADTEAYALALAEMKDALNEAEQHERSLTPMSQIKIYDSNFNLVKEATIPDDGIVEDKELLKLLRQSSELMKYEYMTYYILNK